jgi:hypothetical protein
VAQASFGIEKFTATNCKVGFEGCAGEEVTIGPLKYWIPKYPDHAEAVEQGFTQAGGRVPFGITDFKVKTSGSYPDAAPEGAPVDHVRVDVSPGLATAPAAVPMCTLEEFGDKEVAPESGLYTEPKCKAATEIGVEKVTLYLGPQAEKELGFSDLPIEGKVYNLVQPEGLASYYGAAVALPKLLTEAKGLGTTQYYVHSFVKGSVEWGQEPAGTNQGDYHDYFQVEVSSAIPLISSRQILYGRSGEGDFITNATNCPGNHTTFVTLENTAKEVARESYTTPIGLQGCNPAEDTGGIEAVPFAPKFELESEATASDHPNQITTEAFYPPNEPTKVAQSQVKTASVTLPEGMTLDPSAAHGLEACTPAQARIHSSTFGVACPAGSEVGTVSLEVPTLPAGSFTGSMYLGGPETGPITAPPYILYVVANSKRYGISVRLKAEVVPNPTTGQVTTYFNENPEQPFSSLALKFNRGALTAVANPLICGTPTGSASFTPVTGVPPFKTEGFPVPVTGCAPSLPFSLSQSTEDETPAAGAHTSYAFNLSRNEGEQYLQKIKTTLPLGLVGAIPTVTLCTEAQANAVSCPAASKIGTATTQSGSGSAPFTNTGSVYLTGPYNGAPYGLETVVPAVAGPFNLGNVVARSTININQTTAQVSSETTVPTIVQGIPLRMRSLSVNINKQGFLYNPTNCSALATESTLTSTFGAVQSGLKTPFQVEGCGALPFKPGFTASTSGKHSKANGASLITTLTAFPGQANVKSVLVTLPKQLPSRLTTLQKACLAKVFEENPYNCTKVSPGSEVGTATAITPTLPGVMKGPAYLVSHGGEAFPSLELVLESNGVRVILEGKTNIKKGITTTNFESTPDVPVSSVTVTLPLSSHSALTTERTNTNLCTAKLVMPTVITGQNGTAFKQNTVIAPTGCGVQIVGHKVVGNTAYVTVKTFAAGRISGSGSGLSTRYRTLAGATNAVTLKIPLSGRGLSRGRPFKVKVRIGFVPKKKGAHSIASVTLSFRR